MVYPKINIKTESWLCETENSIPPVSNENNILIFVYEQFQKTHPIGRG